MVVPSRCTPEDFHQILHEIEAFWGSTRTLAYHHPMFIYEFGNTAYVLKEGDTVIAYLFGFVSQTENLGYVHLIGVRQSHQRAGLGEKLYRHFIAELKKSGINAIKAITTPSNEKSIRFHLKLGMTMLGEAGETSIKVVKNYSGPGQDRVVFIMEI